MSKFSLNLANLRKNSKLSQEKLANDIGVARYTVSDWENERTQPDNESLDKLATYFNVSVDYLLGRTNIKNETLSINEEKQYKAPDYIGTYEEAVEFLSSLNLLRAYGGLDINQKTEEEIINLARTIHSVLKMQGAI